MSPSLQIACSFGLTHGIAMLLAVRELRNLRPSPRRRPDGNALIEPAPPPLPTLGQKPLPDCLIPKPFTPARPRVRELA
jgi:hypothetical protein